ncbi:MAG: hypothetical protein BWY99_01881 [Synergistetes bacterium ADurb.BinA166]|nr:MAG: hypothetical protein BWY99_01881 [Synergistetes bacterium ADurb.BinA166]
MFLGLNMEPLSDRATTLMAPDRPRAVSLVPSMGSTAMSTSGSGSAPRCSPLNSMGASSFSPSPMTTTPDIGTVFSM